MTFVNVQASDPAFAFSRLASSVIGTLVWTGLDGAIESAPSLIAQTFAARHVALSVFAFLWTFAHIAASATPKLVTFANAADTIASVAAIVETAKCVATRPRPKPAV